MIYNFGALESSSSEEEEYASQDQAPLTEEDKKRKEITKLQQIRDEKRKKLLALSKATTEEDIEHQNKIKELNKNALKLSRQAEENRKVAQELEIKMKSIPVDPSLENQKQLSESEQQNEAIRNLRLQTDALKTEIAKTKRALALEGGNKNRAAQIQKLRQQLAGLPQEEYDLHQMPTKTAGPQFDIPELKAAIEKLTNEQRTLSLKLKGLKSRANILNPTELKASLKEKMKKSQLNDDIIESLKPKEPKKPPKNQFRDHITQQSRLSVMIRGLHLELVARNKELNHNKTLQGEAGLTKEIERMQKRLHLLESSMSCCV